LAPSDAPTPTRAAITESQFGRRFAVSLNSAVSTVQRSLPDVEEKIFDFACLSCIFTDEYDSLNVGTNFASQENRDVFVTPRERKADAQHLRKKGR
jgi:hypothetical protein